MRVAQVLGVMTALGLVQMVSCSGDKSEPPTAGEGASRVLALDEGSGQSALSERFADYSKDVVLDEDGKITGDSKRSSFEGKELATIGGGWEGKEFAASRYSKKEWQGSRAFEHKSFADGQRSRWDDEEWFLQKQAREADGSSYSQGQTYGTEAYRTGSAREGAGRRLARPGDVETEVRRRVQAEPLIIDQEDYNQMSMGEVKSKLGRD
ncbi:hypothetical protein JIN78_09470 [Roseibacillus ishigakijimensis]|uniref:Uncharacterized protein n=2 Tax=Roseibacillus ishigakijimensis TaxID=454146 RepID=A0A934VMN6_9BACT|nr:hypothetical protein [Roseibacillus ishigakijimensis]MBK1834286.1 hypothetical protein [Roseibacillus ishigakijimensis]